MNGPGGRGSTMEHKIREVADRFLRKGLEDLTESERQVLRHFVERKHITRRAEKDFEEQLTLGQRIADKVATFGGSWTFIIIFGSVLLMWILVNSYLLVRLRHPFDPYPFILLNLVLSMLAAIQAPVIMMSQNRQAVKDRSDAAHDYEVNLKAEIEIMSLHEKLDMLREQQWSQLLSVQQKQIELLETLLRDAGTGAG